ncbi:MAG: 3-isopropylmalate dehydratase [Nitrospirae bacterium]|nr:3-isopropylmalate dehydratase [Nitrospirota bacterium]
MPSKRIINISGRIWKFGDNIDTDIIMPVKYLSLSSIGEMSQYAFEPLIPDFHTKIQPGDILVGGENWGCGSSREQAAAVLKILQIGAVIAKSFARIFYRNAFTNGLCLIGQPGLVDSVKDGDKICIDLINSTIQIDNQSTTYNFSPLSSMMYDLLNAGGLIPYMQKVNSPNR